jgi:hypothetical protein
LKGINMATKAFYDGPGYLDQPYQFGEAMDLLEKVVQLGGSDAAKIRYLNQVVAACQARIQRIEDGEETNEELYGPNHTVLDTTPITL